MADFSPSFGSVGGNTRLPTVDERQQGFPCGPADQLLFNGMFRRIEEELQNVFDKAGIAGSDSDNTILAQSILALIAAATGGSGDYVLMTQARARLPIHFDVQNTDGHLGVTSPGTGQIRIPASKVFLHRGIYQVTTALEDIATLPSKTYHLRWNQTDGFTLNDLADVAYNPTALAETNSTFDSDYDDMLVARVVTNSSNVPTITNLINRTVMNHESVWRGVVLSSLDWAVQSATKVSLSWARSPIKASLSLSEWRSDNAGPNGLQTGAAAGSARAIGVRIPTAGATRYAIPNFEYYYEDDKLNHGTASVLIEALAI